MLMVVRLLLPALSVTVRINCQESVTSYPDVMTLSLNSNFTLNSLLTLSVHDATSVDPMCSSFPVTTICSVSVIATLKLKSFITGGVVSSRCLSFEHETNAAIARTAKIKNDVNVLFKLLFQLISKILVLMRIPACIERL